MYQGKEAARTQRKFFNRIDTIADIPHHQKKPAKLLAEP